MFYTQCSWELSESLVIVSGKRGIGQGMIPFSEHPSGCDEEFWDVKSGSILGNQEVLLLRRRKMEV